MIPMPARWRPAHRARIRRWEFELILRAIHAELRDDWRTLRVLEFGCGSGAGAAGLAELGDLVMSDLYASDDLSVPLGARFTLADITDTDFEDGEFDVIVSNHVIEHVGETDGRPRLAEALAEIKRIAAPRALCAFSVPTALWQLLNAPGQVWGKLENLTRRLIRLLRQQGTRPAGDAGPPRAPDGPERGRRNLPRRFMLSGHGVYRKFWEAVMAFRVPAWRKRLRAAGFEIVSEERLLCYASAKWPIIPPNRMLARLGLCTSHLFLCRISETAKVAPSAPKELAYTLAIEDEALRQAAEAHTPSEVLEIFGRGEKLATGRDGRPVEPIFDSSVQFDAELANYYNAAAEGRDASTTYIGRVFAAQGIPEHTRKEFLARTRQELKNKEEAMAEQEQEKM